METLSDWLVARAECPVRPGFALLDGSRRRGPLHDGRPLLTAHAPYPGLLMLSDTDAGRRRQCCDTRSAEHEGILFGGTDFADHIIVSGLRLLDDCPESRPVLCERARSYPQIHDSAHSEAS